MGVLSDIRADLERSATKLLDEYKDRLMADALRLCNNEADAEDLVMRTFEKYFFDQSKYDPKRGSMLTWLRTVMRNLHTDSLRRRRVEEVVLPPEEIELLTDGRLPKGVLEDPEQAAQEERELIKAINGLSPKIREAVILHYFESLPIAKVAKTLCVSEDSIKNRLYYARKVLLKRLPRAIGKKPLAVILVAFLSLVSAAAVATLPAFEPLRETVASWFASDPAAAPTAPQPSQPSCASYPSQSAAPSPAVAAEAPTSQQEEPAAVDFKQENQEQANQLQETQPQEEKQTMKLAQTFAAAALAVTTVVGTVEAAGVNLEVNKVQQRYPWNGLVDIDYTITLDEGVTLGPDENLEVLMIDKSVEPAVTNRAITFLKVPLPMTAGQHRITWNANADGVTNYSSRVAIRVKIAHYPPSYMVIDVSGGPSTNVYPVSFVNGEPAGSFNVSAYKRDKIVLRRIHPGSYVAGALPKEAGAYRDGSETQHEVTLSRPFYIGIFEVTQKQYANVMGKDPSASKGDERPVEKVSYNTIRGSADWPTVTNVEASSFMGKLRDKCKAWNSQSLQYDIPVGGFDLPTEFQWEYACRAGTKGAIGTTNAYDNTNSDDVEAQLKLMGRYKGNATDGKGGYSEAHTTVGSYNPNPWGIYDMHGNVMELCLDWVRKDVENLNQRVDPKGASSGSATRRERGGHAGRTFESCRSATRYDYDSVSTTSAAVGFRLCRTLP